MTVVVKLKPELGITRVIKSAKLNTNRCVDVQFEEVRTVEQDGETIEIPNLIMAKGRRVVHQDLVDAFNMLRSHLAFLTEMRECVGLSLHELDDNEKLIELFVVESFELSGTDADETMKLIGSKTLQSGGTLPLKGPAIKLVNYREDAYKYTDEYNATHVHIYDELEKYLNEGKIAPSAQIDMFNNDEDPEDE